MSNSSVSACSGGQCKQVQNQFAQNQTGKPGENGEGPKNSTDKLADAMNNLASALKPKGDGGGEAPSSSGGSGGAPSFNAGLAAPTKPPMTEEFVAGLKAGLKLGKEGGGADPLMSAGGGIPKSVRS